MANCQACLVSYLLFSMFCIWFPSQHVLCGNETTTEVHVGVVLDMNTPTGAEASVSISLAILDFYAMHPNYKTKLMLHTRDTDDVIGAASAVLDLLKNVQVQAIIGPQRTDQVTFAIELGRRAHVPIISFSATSPFLSPEQSPYFIRAGQNDSSQVKAITALMQGYNWQEIVIIYEDTEYGNGIIPHLTDAFQEAGVQVLYKKAIPTLADDFSITIELNKIMAMPTRVILVHTSTPLGSRLFKLANKEGMMSEGYAWLITDGLSNSIDDMDPIVVESMEGAIGLRPYIPRTKQLENFKFRWKRRFPSMRPNSNVTDLNIFGLWAYDTIWALAMAVERIGPVQNRFIKAKDGKSSTDLDDLGISENGHRLLDEMLNTKLQGMSGEFQLVNGNLQPSEFEILNVIGKGERIIGYWTPDKGIIPRAILRLKCKVPYSTNTSVLKKIIWPGDSAEKPIGRDTPASFKKLRVGVPVKKGFTEFVKIVRNNVTSKIEFDGFSIDMFRAVFAKLPPELGYEFIPSPTDGKETTSSYDNLLYGVYNETFDAVVGDTTIAADRWYVDFTLPYSDSGVSMVVPLKPEKNQNIWIFIKSFSWDLWLVIIAASFFTGIAVAILECCKVDGPPQQITRTNYIDWILWLSLSSSYYAERDRVAVGKWSRYVLGLWHFLMITLVQSYVASFSSMLTHENLTPIIVDPTQHYVGYQQGSFVKELLINKLKFQETKLKSYASAEEYDEALSKGSGNGGVAAIFDETPYIKLFLAKYCSKYMITGPTYKTDGFGFAFPVGSPLVSLVSKAILNVTQGSDADDIERKYFHGNSCEDQDTAIASKSYGLTFNRFIRLIFAMLSVIISSFLVALLQTISEKLRWKKPVTNPTNNPTPNPSSTGNNSGNNQTRTTELSTVVGEVSSKVESGSIPSSPDKAMTEGGGGGEIQE